MLRASGHGFSDSGSKGTALGTARRVGGLSI